MSQYMGQMGDQMGAMMGMMLLMALVWILVIVVTVVAVVWGIRWLLASRSPQPEAPLAILQRRYAAGELGHAEYERMRQELLRDRAA